MADIQSTSSVFLIRTLFIPTCGSFLIKWKVLLNHLFIYLYTYWFGCAASHLDIWGIFDLNCSMWDLIPWPGMEPGTLHWEQSFSHWTTREVLAFTCLFFQSDTTEVTKHAFLWISILPARKHLFFGPQDCFSWQNAQSWTWEEGKSHPEPVKRGAMGQKEGGRWEERNSPSL